MSDVALLRDRLQLLHDSTASGDEVEAPGFWVGDTAGERRVADDARSGRLCWRQARRAARLGLDALERGELEMADLWLWQAVSLRMAALECQMRPEQFAALGASARRRGPRAKDAEQDRLLAEAVATQRAKGLTDKAALHAALTADPNLAALCRDRRPEAILRALRRRK